MTAERGTTPTMLKIAPEGFQHLEQPHAWLCAMFELSETVTGEDLQWQCAVDEGFEMALSRCWKGGLLAFYFNLFSLCYLTHFLRPWLV